MALPRIVDILLVVLIFIFVLCGLFIVIPSSSDVVLAAAEHGLHLALDLVVVLGRLLLVIQDSCGQIAKKLRDSVMAMIILQVMNTVLLVVPVPEKRKSLF